MSNRDEEDEEFKERLAAALRNEGMQSEISEAISKANKENNDNDK